MIRRIVGVVCAAVLAAGVAGGVAWMVREDYVAFLWAIGVVGGIVLLGFGAAWGLDR